MKTTEATYSIVRRDGKGRLDGQTITSVEAEGYTVHPSRRFAEEDFDMFIDGKNVGTLFALESDATQYMMTGTPPQGGPL